MIKISKSIKIVKKDMDNENLTYFLSLTPKERLQHLEELRTKYINWQISDDLKPRLQRVYSITKRA
jgi:hypothetical protein